MSASWEIVRGWGGFYRHIEYPQYEIHEGTQGSRFELRNTLTGNVIPLFVDCPSANIYTVTDTVDEAIRTNSALDRLTRGNETDKL